MTRALPALLLALAACGDKDDDTGATAGDLTGAWELVCTTAATGSPYAEGDLETFDVAADGTLTVGGATTFTGPTDSGATRTWTDGTVSWELSDVSTGTFNEFNLYDASGAFLAQFTEEDGGTGGGGGAVTWTLEATRGASGGSTPQPYELGDTVEFTWDGAEAMSTSDSTYGDLEPAYTGEITLEGADASRFTGGYGFSVTARTGTDGSSSRFDYVVFVSDLTTAEYGFAEVEVTHVPLDPDGNEGTPASSQLRPQSAASSGAAQHPVR